MYGTIARLKVKPDRVEALQLLTASYDDLEVPGFVGTHVYGWTPTTRNSRSAIDGVPGRCRGRASKHTHCWAARVGIG